MINRKIGSLLALGLTFLSPNSQAALLAYWNFNTSPGSGAAAVPANGTVYSSDTISADIGNASISTAGWSGTVTNWYFANNTATTNALNGDLGLTSLNLGRYAGNNTYIDFIFSTTGYSDIEISFVSFKTSQAYSTALWEYSTDGVDYFSFNPGNGELSASTTSIPGGNTWETFQTIILPEAASDVENLTVRYTLSGGSSNDSNVNYRIDNVQINAVPEPTGALLSALGLLFLNRRVR